MTRTRAFDASNRLFWAIVWLAVGLVSVKAYYLGLPAWGVSAWRDYLRDLMDIGERDAEARAPEIEEFIYGESDPKGSSEQAVG